MTDPYRILKISRKATADQIQSAYRKLAAKLHPDRNPGDKKAESQFKEVQEAYEILRDPDRRKRYDETGDTTPIRDDFAAKASQTLLQAFSASVGILVSSGRNPKTLDLMTDVRERLRDPIRERKENVRKCLEIKKSLAEMMGRINVKEGQENVLRDSLAAEIGNLEKAVGEMQKADKVSEAALAMLADYSYQCDDPMAVFVNAMAAANGLGRVRIEWDNATKASTTY
jgi:curved DNA-binding protein CbpA